MTIVVSPCACGCGEMANPRRRFIIGHARRGMRTQKFPCTVTDCLTIAIARGWCEKHYVALRDQGPCGVLSCTKRAKTAGLCPAHYKRKWRLGDPLAGGPMQTKGPKGGGCTTPDGYRVYTVEGVRSYEHRSVMEQLLGRPLLPFENVHHRNGQRADNRPENLELWTKKQPYGQRVDDLIEFVATYYAAEVLAAVKEKS